MKKPGAIIVVDLFPEILESLLVLLRGLSPPQWDLPTVCGDWTVKDIALHLLGDEVGNLSWKRDGFSAAGEVSGWEELVTFINEWNALWVLASRRMSPRLVCDQLGYVGPQMCGYFRSLDPHAIGGPVSWAGPDPAPIWLDLAREYTERWLHQQHIRDAVGKSGLTEPRFLVPVLDAFVRALPRTYENVGAPEGTLVSLTITGPSGGRWSLLREGQRWSLYLGIRREADAEMVIPEDVAWRAFTRGLERQQALSSLSTRGDEELALMVLDTVSIIA